MGAAIIPPLVVGLNPAEHVLGPTSFNLSCAKVNRANLPKIAETISRHRAEYGSLSLDEPEVFAAARIRLSNGSLIAQDWPVQDRRSGSFARAYFDAQGVWKDISVRASKKDIVLGQRTGILDNGLLQTRLRAEASVNRFQILQSAGHFANANSPNADMDMTFNLAFKIYTELLVLADVERNASDLALNKQFPRVYDHMIYELAENGTINITSADMVENDIMLNPNQRDTILDFSVALNRAFNRISIEQTHGSGIRDTEEDDDSNNLPIPKFLPTAPLLEMIFKELEKEF